MEAIDSPKERYVKAKMYTIKNFIEHTRNSLYLQVSMFDLDKVTIYPLSNEFIVCAWNGMSFLCKYFMVNRDKK